MALSPEGPSGGAPPPKNEIAAFVIGLVLGLGAGGTILTLVAFAIIAGLTQLFFPKSSNNIAWLPFLGAIPALALGWWAVVLSRRAMNFFSGALIGP